MLCKDLHAIVFLVDYPLAPGSKYPVLIECCVKAYLYIKLLIDKVIQLNQYEIILTGDSAGGNICIGLLNWLIMNKLQLPKGVLLCYPMCNLNFGVFTPSFLHCFHDHFVTYGLMTLCQQLYLEPGVDFENDFMIK